MKRGTLVARVAGERLHDRGKISSGIGEHVLDAARPQPGDIGLRSHGSPAMVPWVVLSFTVASIALEERPFKVTARSSRVNHGHQIVGRSMI